MEISFIMHKIYKLFIIFSSSFKKDFNEALSYRLNFYLSFLTIFFSSFILFIFSNQFLQFDQDYVNGYKISYFTYYLSGFILLEISLIIASSISMNIKRMQISGVFEEIIQYDNYFIALIASISYPLFRGLLKILIYIIVGIYFFNLDKVGMLEIFLIILVFLTLSIGIIGMGLIASCFSILFKHDNLIISFISLLIVTFSGIFFPPELLPDQTQFISYTLPSTWALDIVRGLFETNNIRINTFSVLILLFQSLFLYLVGSFLLKKSINISKKTGTIVEF